MAFSFTSCLMPTNHYVDPMGKVETPIDRGTYVPILYYKWSWDEDDDTWEQVKRIFEKL